MTDDTTKTEPLTDRELASIEEDARDTSRGYVLRLVTEVRRSRAEEATRARPLADLPTWALPSTEEGAAEARHRLSAEPSVMQSRLGANTWLAMPSMVTSVLEYVHFAEGEAGPMLCNAVNESRFTTDLDQFRTAWTRTCPTCLDLLRSSRRVPQ